MRVLTVRGYLMLSLVVVLTLVGWSVARAQEATVRHAIGTFEVSVTPADAETTEAGIGLSRYLLSKSFVGGIEGVGTGQMLAGGPPGSQTTGVYVALERVVGALDGRQGAFLLAHRGDMDPSGYTLSITVVPGSGTGELVGLTGEFELTIEGGEHRYDLAYRLPPE